MARKTRRKGKARSTATGLLPLGEVMSGITPQSREVMRLLAGKPSPALLHPHDVGEQIDYYADYVWHSLEKEKGFPVKERGKLGLVQPNSDIAFIIGFQEPGQPPQYQPVSEFLVHNHDTIVEDVRFRSIACSWLRVRAFFIAATSSGLLARVEVTNAGAFDKVLSVLPVLHRMPGRPGNRYGREYYHSYGRVRRTSYTSAGQLADARYSRRSDAVLLTYDEHVPRRKRPVGKLLCGLTSDKKSKGFFFSPALEDATSRIRNPKCSGLIREVKLCPGQTCIVRFAVQFQRYEGTGDNPIIPAMSRADAERDVLKSLSRLLTVDETQYIEESIRAYMHYPVIELPEQRLASAALCSLDMPRGSTYGPSGAMKRPFYNFCRVNSADPHDWWSYGQHAHESTSLITLAVTNPKLAGEMLLNHFDMQEPDGKVPYGVSQSGAMELREATMPILTWLAWNIYLWSGDRGFLRQVFAGGRRFHDWWMRNRTDGTSILSHWQSPHETVRDISAMPVWQALPMDDFLAPDVNACMLREEELLAGMARELGLSEVHCKYARVASRRRKLMNRLMWDGRDACYYGISRKTGGKVRIRDIGSLMPLWAGAPSRQRAQQMSRMIEDPCQFGTPFPLPTLALSDGNFGRNVAMPAGENWPNAQGAAPCMGDTWPELTYMIVEGLERYGHYATAADIACRNMKMVLDDLIRTSHFREHYDSISGFGTGLYDYVWSSLASAFLVRFILGIRPGADGLYVRPELPADWDAAGITNLHVRQYTVDVTVGMVREPARSRTNGRSSRLDNNGSIFIPWQRAKRRINIEYLCSRRPGKDGC